MRTDTESAPLRVFEVADPARLIEQIARTHRLTEGLVLLAVVKHPSTEQALVHVEAFPGGLVDPVPDDLNHQLCDVMDRLPLPAEHFPIEHCVVTVIVRSGFTVFGRREMGWMSGWRYSNHLHPADRRHLAAPRRDAPAARGGGRSAFTGDLFLVTEHGWLDGVTGWGGHEPRMIA
jgi:hypothetical protein